MKKCIRFFVNTAANYTWCYCYSNEYCKKCKVRILRL